jgi:hypothetical protein
MSVGKLISAELLIEFGKEFVKLLRAKPGLRRFAASLFLLCNLFLCILYSINLYSADFGHLVFNMLNFNMWLFIIWLCQLLNIIIWHHMLILDNWRFVYLSYPADYLPVYPFADSARVAKRYQRLVDDPVGLLASNVRETVANVVNRRFPVVRLRHEINENAKRAGW